MAEPTIVQEAPAAAAPTPPAAGQCPRCGAEHVAGQMACLSCAGPLGDPDGRSRRTKMLAAGAAALLILGGLGAGYAVSRVADDDEVTVAKARAGQPAPPPDPGATPPSQPPPAQPAPAPSDGSASADEPPAAEDSAPEDAPDVTPPAGDSDAGGSGDTAPENWPAGRSAYTVVLLSSPDRAGAQARAREALRAGIEAGVLKSDDYRSLNPGYWVTFAGQYGSKAEAQRQAARYAEQGFDGGYARYVRDS